MSQPDLERGASAFFIPDHQRCDDLWAKVESAASTGDRGRAREEWSAFEAAMQRHFTMEEDVLFPALDQAMGMRGTGPVAVMIHEHAQMRALLAQMAASAKAEDFEALLDHGDTLMLVIQQHNSKEEHMLYPTADDALAATWPTLAARLAKY